MVSEKATSSGVYVFHNNSLRPLQCMLPQSYTICVRPPQAGWRSGHASVPTGVPGVNEVCTSLTLITTPIFRVGGLAGVPGSGGVGSVYYDTLGSRDEKGSSPAACRGAPEASRSGGAQWKMNINSTPILPCASTDPVRPPGRMSTIPPGSDKLVVRSSRSASRLSHRGDPVNEV